MIVQVIQFNIGKIYFYNLYLIILEEDLWEMNGVLHDKCIVEIENTIQNMFYLEKTQKIFYYML